MNIKPCVATIGYFDGVHKGHQFLLEHVKQMAKEKGLESAVITFTEHPRKVMQPDYHLDLLSTPEEKRQMLKATGIEHIIEFPFTIELSQLTAREFMTEVLQKQLHVQTLFIGYDHRFGHNRSEGFEDYQRYGAEIGMDIIHAPVCEIDNVNVSSSAIRRFLCGGEITIATHCLGYEYFLAGKIVDGFKLGRKLGFPTANIQINEPGKLIPADGVYAVRVFLEGTEYAGMLNIVEFRYRFRQKFRKSDDFRRLNRRFIKRARSADCDEVNRAVSFYRVDYRARARAFTYYTFKSRVQHIGRINVHAFRRRGAATAVWFAVFCGRRARVIDKRIPKGERQRLIVFHKGENLFVSSVARRVNRAAYRHDIARIQRFQYFNIACFDLNHLSLDYSFAVARAMALYGDRDGQSRNVGVFRFDKHAKGGNVAAEAFRTDAQSVDFFKHFLFKGRKIFVGVFLVQVA